MNTGSIHDLLELALKHRASDVILKSGMTPAFRIDGRVRIPSGPPLSPKQVFALCEEIIDASGRDLLLMLGADDISIADKHTDELMEKIERGEEIDIDFTISELMRVRANIFKQRSTYGATLRIIPLKPYNFTELHLPDHLKDLCKLTQGMIIVTGPTGSGKSTTLAALLQHINETREANIVTIEDPIEYIFQEGKSVIHQREVGLDTKSFSSGLRSVLRQTPDVILIGEIRDADSMSVALNAAEVGHLVLTSLHTTSAPAAIDRILHVFPPEDQPFIRVQLSQVLGGIISQKLVPKANGVGRLPAVEVMRNSPTIKKIIEDGALTELYVAMREGQHFGMNTMNQALEALVSSGQVSFEVAMEYAGNITELKQMLRKA
jgi:twitching motility protein PilT